MNKILVIGSTNIDMIARVKHLPRPGETVGFLGNVWAVSQEEA